MIIGTLFGAKYTTGGPGLGCGCLMLIGIPLIAALAFVAMDPPHLRSSNSSLKSLDKAAGTQEVNLVDAVTALDKAKPVTVKCQRKAD